MLQQHRVGRHLDELAHAVIEHGPRGLEEAHRLPHMADPVGRVKVAGLCQRATPGRIKRDSRGLCPHFGDAVAKLRHAGFDRRRVKRHTDAKRAVRGALRLQQRDQRRQPGVCGGHNKGAFGIAHNDLSA